MTAEKAVQTTARRKRVQRLKRLIVFSLITAILTPTVLSVVLFVRLHGLEKQVAHLERMVADMQKQQSENADATPDIGIGEGLVFRLEINMPDESEEPKETKPAEASQDEGIQDGAEQQEEAVRKVYLTFDDGPSSNTNKILDILAQYDVKATFFVVGKEESGRKTHTTGLWKRGIRWGCILIPMYISPFMLPWKPMQRI